MKIIMKRPLLSRARFTSRGTLVFPFLHRVSNRPRQIPQGRCGNHFAARWDLGQQGVAAAKRFDFIFDRV